MNRDIPCKLIDQSPGLYILILTHKSMDYRNARTESYNMSDGNDYRQGDYNQTSQAAEVATVTVSPKRKRKSSLSIILNALQDVNVVVELKNDKEYHGKVDYADKHMNIALDTTGNANHSLDDERNPYVQGKSIRYIHIPKNINIYRLLSTHTKNEDKKKRVTTINTADVKRRKVATPDDIILGGVSMDDT